MYKSVFKRIIDLILALLGLIILSPIFICVVIFLFFANGGKPFFFQARPGKDRKIFKIIKFKTMNDKTDVNGNLLTDEKRTTAIGSFIRKTSLDEIPQLLNVIKGDMSLIGPRPLLPQYLPLYNDEQNRRHNVKPGITGLAQINGRNAISWNEKFKLDVWYVENISYKIDFKILILTIFKIFKTNDINASKTTTMDAFKGNN